MQFSIKVLTLIIGCFFINSCATYTVQLRKDAKGWEATPLPDKKLNYQVFLIGDAGNSSPGYLTAPLQMLKQELPKAGKNSAVVFLGDNVYEAGLVKKNSPEREQSEYRLNAQLDIVKEHPGRVFYVSGNHDWKNDGIDGVRREEEYIEDYLDRDHNVFLPDNGCSGPKSEDLSDNLGMIAVDSQWFLTKWDNEPEINEDCPIRTREEFFANLMDEARDFRGKNLLIIGHHPLFSVGWHGGNYSLKEHIFPLTMVHADQYIPTPGIGTLAITLDEAISTRQEISHPVYQQYKDIIEDVARHHGDIVYAAGHEHNLQYAEDDEIAHILSGAGSKNSPVWKGKYTPFAYGGMGYAVMNVYEDGEVWVEYIKAAEDVKQVLNQDFDEKDWKNLKKADIELKKLGKDFSKINYEKSALLTPKVIYRQKIKEALETTEEQTPDVFPEYEEHKDSIKISVLERDELWDLGGWFWGKMWSETYFMDVDVPVLDLENIAQLDEAKPFKLTAFKKGGGFQTKSVRLIDSLNNRLYQMRSLEKSAQKMFYPFNKTFAKHILKYNFTAGNPFGAFLLEPMQEAIGVYHTNPKLYYTPKQPRLGKYNRYGGELYLFEERLDENWRDNGDFGHSDNIISTSSVLEERMKNDKAVIDQPNVLRNRLFDMLIGDWDRHQDQWRWAELEIPDSDRKLYRPISRDRDQVFARYEGLFFQIARLGAPFVRASHPFDDDIKKKEVRWLNFQSRFFDDFFMNELTWEDWEKEVKHIQSTLTDEVIVDGVDWLPDTVYAVMGDMIIDGVKKRRDHLMETAREYHDFLYKTVKIVGTKKENLFLIERLDDAQTKVTVYEWKDDRTAKDKIYERLLDNEITKEIELYGIEGDDEYQVTGKVKKGPLIRLVGGIDDDVYKDDSKVSGLGKKTRIYDDLVEDNEVIKSRETRDFRSNRNEANSWIFRDRQYNFGTPLPMVGFNLDDGVFVGVGYTYSDYGYKKMSKHNFKSVYSFGFNAFAFNYEGDYSNAFKKWDFYLKAKAETPNYADNFFGIGNGTERITDDRQFYRYSRDWYRVFAALKKRDDGGLFFAFGPLAETIKVAEEPERFVAGPSDDDGIRAEVFDRQYFGGAQMIFDYTNIDNVWMPDRGIQLHVESSFEQNLQDSDRRFANFQGFLGAYLPLGIYDKFLYATRVGFSTNVGEYDFYHAPTLGGEENLRGFRQERYAGRTIFYHNNELRYAFAHKDDNPSPFTYGVSAAFDYGRVWSDLDQTDTWHYGYGGSIWAAPFDYVAITAGVMLSKDDTRFSLRLGYDF
jgi:hypothetical protein